MAKLIHVAKIFTSSGTKFLFLRNIENKRYAWFLEQEPGVELATDTAADTVEEAIRLARRKWKNQDFEPLNCGFKFSLPERDEHGINALFFQMASSLNSFNGIYYEEELGCNCIVHLVPLKARELWEALKAQSRL